VDPFNIDEAVPVLYDALQEGKLKEKEKQIEDESKVMQQKIDELKKQRDETIKQVKPDISSLYEQIVRSKRGLAMIRVEGEDCPACQMHLRPQIVNEIKLKEKIVVCESCSRILYE